MVRIALVVGFLAVLPALACSQTDEGGKPSSEASVSGCALPPEVASIDLTALPADLRDSPLDDVRRLITFRDGLTATVVVEGSVEETLGLYGRAVTHAGYTVLSEDFEGFEAELFFNSLKEVGTVRIRETSCSDKTLAYVKLVRAK